MLFLLFGHGVVFVSFLLFGQACLFLLFGRETGVHPLTEQTGSVK